MDTMSYRSTIRIAQAPSGPSVRFVQTRREFAEWLVNDEPLVKLLASARPGYANSGLDLIPVVSWNMTGADAVERLLLHRPPDLPSGRHSILTCAECGDTGCSCVSAVIERTGNAYVWHTFGWENDYDEDAPWLEHFVGKGPYRFESSAYERVLREMNALGVES